MLILEEWPTFAISFEARHSYVPPSSDCILVIFTKLLTNPSLVTKSPTLVRNPSVTGNPSSVHVIWGKGVPVAVHFNDKNDPGSTVCSGKVYAKTGGSSEKEKKIGALK